MGMTVNRRKDTKTPKVLMHKVADIRGGVSVNVSELGGDYLREGAILSAPVDGICHVVKIAVVVADVAAADKTIKVEKFHNFKAGDFVMLDVNSAAVKISSIDESNKAYDTLTVATALGAISKGAQVVEAAAASTAEAKTSALKYVPLAVVGTGKRIEPKTNLDTDAWVIAVTKGNPVPECVAKHLKCIVNY
jgi:hypothetical protein